MAASLYGVMGALGTWPNWRDYFDLSPRGAMISFLASALIAPALFVIVMAVETNRAQLLGAPPPTLSWTPFVLLTLGWIGSFVLTSGVIAVMLRRTEDLMSWWTVRNWTLVWMMAALSALAGLVLIGLPFAVLNGALLAAYLGLLAIDIRLAQRVGGFGLGTAILIGCIIVSTGLVVLLTATLQVIGAPPQ